MLLKDTLLTNPFCEIRKFINNNIYFINKNDNNDDIYHNIGRRRLHIMIMMIYDNDDF